MTAQESRAMFDLWYEDHIGDENKPVRAAAWEVWQHLYQPVARTPMTRKEINECSRDAQIGFCIDKHPTYEVAMVREVELRHGITQEKQG